MDLIKLLRKLITFKVCNKLLTEDEIKTFLAFAEQYNHEISLIIEAL
jgi:hypothetical protein